MHVLVTEDKIKQKFERIIAIDIFGETETDEQNLHSEYLNFEPLIYSFYSQLWDYGDIAYLNLYKWFYGVLKKNSRNEESENFLCLKIALGTYVWFATPATRILIFKIFNSIEDTFLS